MASQAARTLALVSPVSFNTGICLKSVAIMVFLSLFCYCAVVGVLPPTGLCAGLNTNNAGDFTLTTWRTANKVAHNDKRTDFAELVDWGHKLFEL